MKYRMYVDEAGNSGYKTLKDPEHRHLSLTGVIFELDYIRSTVHPELEDLKRRYFDSHPDEPIVLHRKELAHKNFPFGALRDEQIADSFFKELLDLLHATEYVVITAAIDKAEHLAQYRSWRNDPYHYCMEVIVERYVRWLENMNAQGDIMSESRGRREDERLAAAFTQIYTDGTDYVEAVRIQEHLTSKQIKVKLKASNVAGLQYADLIAYPSFQGVHAHREGRPIADGLSGKIYSIIEAKYRRGPSGQIEGYGTKWLP